MKEIDLKIFSVSKVNPRIFGSSDYLILSDQFGVRCERETPES